MHEEVAKLLLDMANALKALAAVARQSQEVQSSVELAQDSKGNIKPTVKVYAADPLEAAKLAQELYDGLARKYPPANGNGNQA